MTSSGNVVSRLSDFRTRSSFSLVLPIPLARALKPLPWFGPKAIPRVCSSVSASCPTVSTPLARSRSNVLGPTPGRSEAGFSPTVSSQLSWSRTKKPSGLSRSDAIFAISLLGASPIEQTRYVASLIRRLISWARDWGTGEPERSTYASSRPTTSTSSLNSCSVSMTFTEPRL